MCAANLDLRAIPENIYRGSEATIRAIPENIYRGWEAPIRAIPENVCRGGRKLLGLFQKISTGVEDNY